MKLRLKLAGLSSRYGLRAMMSGCRVWVIVEDVGYGYREAGMFCGGLLS